MLGPLFALVAASAVALASTQYVPPPAPPSPPHGSTSYGGKPVKPSYQQPPYQQPSHPKTSYEQPPYAKTSYEEPTYAKPSYEQPSYEQHPYAKTSYEQPPYKSSSYQQPSYGPYYGGPGPRDLTGDIAAVRARISALTTTDKMTTARLDGLYSKIGKVKDTRADFFNNMLPAEQARIKAEDDRIAKATARLRDHAALADEVAALTAKVNNFVAALRRAREVYNSLNADINDLLVAERDQQYDISNVTALARDQEICITITDDEDVSPNEDFASALYAPLNDVVDIINAERCETFSITLDSLDSVTLKFERPFTRTPEINLAIPGYFIAEDGDSSSGSGYGDSYQSYDQSSYGASSQALLATGILSYTATTDDVTISRTEERLNISAGKVYVVVTAYVIDNSRVEYKPAPHKTTTRRPRVTTSSYAGRAYGRNTAARDYNGGK